MVTLEVDNQAQLHQASKLPGSGLKQIKARLTFDSPQYLENERRGFSREPVGFCGAQALLNPGSRRVSGVDDDALAV